MKHLSADQKQFILDLLIVGGIMMIAVVAPNAIRLFSPLKAPKRRDRSRFYHSLEQRGYIEHQSDHIRLTKSGWVHARLLYAVNKPRNPADWDGRWRLICFDIPEDLHAGRDALRFTIRQFGFMKLQQSVYIYPFDCLTEIRAICQDYGVIGYVSLGTIDYLENDTSARKQFSLAPSFSRL